MCERVCVLFIYLFIYLNQDKEGNVLFHDTLNIFSIWLYGVGHIMVKEHSCNVGGNPLSPLHRQQDLFYMHHPTGRMHIPLLHQSSSTDWNEKFISYKHLKTSKLLKKYFT